MQAETEIALDSLVGRHTLTGVETDTKELEIFDGCFEFVNVIKFILDDVTYMAIEDPDDGYRSYMEKIVITNDAVKNTFSSQEVFCVKDNEDADILFVYNTDTSKLLLAIGTSYYDNYYPFCVFDWYPENLTVNESVD